MSTFSGLNTAYRGLVAARAGLDVVGQNISNATTEGYTRQRVATSSIGPAATVGLFSAGVRVGQGVSVDAIARLGDLHLDAQVRGSSAAAGYQSVRASVLSTLETSFAEPGENGLSTQLQEFWGAWQDVANRPGEAAPAAALLGRAGVLASEIAGGHAQVENQWAQSRSRVDAMATELNDAASMVADLNGRIRAVLASGGTANELLDLRGSLTESIASLAGGTVRQLPDGTVDVLLGGNALVSGDTFRPVRVTGAPALTGTGSAPVSLEWAHRPGAPVPLDSGSIAGTLSVLAPATGTGTGGVLAEAAATYNALATDLAAQVNAVHRVGATPGSATPSGLDFFSFVAGRPPAEGLRVAATAVAAIAVGTPGAGGSDGSVADAISQLGRTTTAPDARWAAFVTATGVTTRSELHFSQLTDLASISAKNAQQSATAVDLDEENVTMLTFQHAYQGAARVMTAVDEMLDTLINRTGIVGR
ncbi:flagellar hook-associated protein FlgK [Planctomonas psychrotolerans]|uniref:flagellar hook-associated protein FlgK n=1 Tax=Planctomonas psychrotolerans TaxID=2528712 RepID=UPI00123C3018|nr:flagellar hook-associated protein FlgK [Planctomonas psychrotolerans]